MDKCAGGERTWTVRYRVWRNEELPEECRRLLDAARDAAGAAYCPYSQFAVGAALLLDNGEVVRGANQENVAYPSGLCAERTALFSAGAAFPSVAVRMLAITAHRVGETEKVLAAPCGACRQVMAEVVRRQGRPFDVVMQGAEETIVVKADDLLPWSFDF